MQKNADFDEKIIDIYIGGRYNKIKKRLTIPVRMLYNIYSQGQIMP